MENQKGVAENINFSVHWFEHNLISNNSEVLQQKSLKIIEIKTFNCLQCINEFIIKFFLFPKTSSSEIKCNQNKNI